MRYTCAGNNGANLSWRVLQLTFPARNAQIQNCHFLVMTLEWFFPQGIFSM